MFRNKEKERIAELEQQLRERDEEIRALKIKLLQKEMRPHFIFNVLLSIKQLCLENPTMAAEALQSFSVYLRARINSMVSTENVPFEEELKIITNYIALEKIEPTVEFDVDFDIQYTDFRVPLLSVQPMVENAIRHGIDTQSGEGVVCIRTLREGDHAIVEISDNGHRAESETSKQVKHRGIGITNTRDRIRFMCGGDMDLVYTGRGTIARYTIPIA